MNNKNAIKHSSPPLTIRIAGGIWVSTGIGFIVVAVLSFLVVPFDEPTISVVVFLFMLGVAVTFLYVGLRTMLGRAKDVLGNAIGSIIIGLAGSVIGSDKGIAILVPSILAFTGILALVSRSQYKAWRSQIASADSVSPNIKDTLEDNLPSLQKSQQAEIIDDKVINQRQIKEFSTTHNNSNSLLLKKVAFICILVGISLPLLGLAFVSNYVPDIDFIWNMQNMEIVLPIDVDRGRGIPLRLYEMVREDYEAGETPENIVRKLAMTKKYPRIAKQTQEFIKEGLTADEILAAFARSEVQAPIAISYKYF